MIKYTTTRKYNQHTKTSVEYLNVECAFDIETTSTYVNDDKFAFMYLWGFGIGDNCDYLVYGRTWEDFINMINNISNEYNLSKNRRLICYVHNLGYEFQFMRKHFKWLEVFSVDERKPIKALCSQGIEFRDSYILSGLNLKKTAENLHSHNIKKLVGDLDYQLVRTSETPITEKELQYLENDVVIVLHYINEQLMQYKKIHAIPLTNTGRVREYVRDKCLYGDKSSYKSSKSKRKNYRYIIENLTLESSEYTKLKECFMGGFTHANSFYTDKTIENVHSIDFTSSYPAVMISEKFPMGKSFKPTKEEIIKNGYDFYFNNFCCIIGVVFYNLKNKFFNESYLSSSKCKLDGKYLINNGRVYESEYVATYITDVDYWIISQCYSCDNAYFEDLICYPKNYLPKPIIESVLELYQSKTELKNVAGKESEYLLSKGMLNSIYGMAVTDIVRDNIIYDDNWSIEPVNLDEEIDKYNRKQSRVLFYPWGVWITAYARRNLWLGILAIGNDYVYSDTDSIKFINIDKHKNFINEYNKLVENKIETVLDYYNIDKQLIKPKTIEGKEKMIGIWDYEGMYSRFKTLGAKRYLTEKNSDLEITVAGLGKKSGIDYLKKCYKTNDNIFKNFTNDLYIPKGETGKNTHTYIDIEKEYPITDYLGNTITVNSKSGVHLESAEYSLSISDIYIKFYKMLQRGEIYKGGI